MMYPTTEQFKESIKLIESSVEGEKSDAMFYEWLIENIPTKNLTPNQVKDITTTIEGIKTDEMAHNQTFKKLYKQFTKKNAMPEEEVFVPPSSFEEGIVKALNGELTAVTKYRKILAGLPNNYYRDQVFDILTDELRHANLYNWIYTTIRTTGNK
ncbi:MAG: ferritin family protein [Cellulosilyticaceae bacterium]